MSLSATAGEERGDTHAAGSTRLFIIDQTLKDFQGHHFEYDAAIAEAALAVKLSATIVANRKYERTGSEAAEVVPWYQTTWYDSTSDARHARTFWSETLDFFQSRALTSNDIVLVHTVALAEFQQIVDFCHEMLWRDVAGLPAIFVILRRDPDEYSQDLLNALRAKLRRAFEIPDLSRRLRLCSDTDQLSEGWAQALGQMVLTLPIPFRHALVDRLVAQRRAGAPLQVVYLGDARNEKGYQHFPGMAQALWRDFVQPGRVEITLQSNYNLPGGEGGIPQARLKLQRYPYGVTLLTDPLEPEDYYAVLAKADVIVLPYDRQAYARRSSGVLNEAIAAGKVAVVPEGTWLASQLSPDRGVVYRHPGGLADAVIAAIEAFPALARGAAAYQAKYRGEQNPDRFVQALLRNRRDAQRPSAGSVLYVMDGDSVVNRTGAGSVASQQMQALVELGYRVHAVFQRIHVGDDHNVHAMRDWMDAIREEVRALRLASVWGAGHTPFYGRAGMMSETQILRERNLRLDADVNYRSASAVPAGLIETLRGDPPKFAVVNYVQSVPFARMLAGGKTPLLCEAHDIQSFQIALRSPHGFQEADLDLELKLLGQASHVVALNPLEADFLADRLGRDRVSFIPQPVSNGPARLIKLAGARDLAELVETCGPSHPAFDPKRAPPAPNAATYFRQAKSIDLLYVSSNHGPNLEGLQHFLHHVFYARLIERGVTLAVAGTLCDRLGPLEGPQVLLAHRVKDLEPLYAAAKVVILPILDGAGSAIKTIEAMARAKPVVATSFAMRGVDRSSEPFPVFDDWTDFGDRILALLSSQDERLAASQASYRLSLLNGNDGAYARRLGRAVHSTLGLPGDAAAGASAPIPPKPPAKLLEWSEPIRLFNALSFDYLRLDYLAPGEVEAYRAAPLERSDARTLFSGLLETLDGARLRPEDKPDALFENLMALIGDAPRVDRRAALDRREIFTPAGVAARVIAYDTASAPKVVWRSSDRLSDKTARAVGVVSATLPEVTPGMILEQDYDLASAPAAGLGPCVLLGGMHEPEEGDVRRWTGPGTVSTFVIAISRRYDVELCLPVHDVLDGAIFEHAWMSIDGLPIPTLKWSRDSRLMLVAAVPAASHVVVDRMAIALHTPRTVSPNSLHADNVDARRLGLRLGRLQARSQITSASALDQSFVARAFAAMAEREAPDAIYGGYRDLLGRDPDPSGNAHYLKLLTERELTPAGFFRNLIGSGEFSSKYATAGLVELLNKHLVAP